ncbi:MAG TPA: SMC family ATPase [Streptosporangiaceae bacterium]
MRPHRLEVTAFGAFGGTAEVDFDALADSGLFLLHGETGAGKTTLLDAIGFALYGRVAGERNKTRRLRSDHAPAGLRTQVVFETTIGARHLRITRNPQQTRPKKHGHGVTTEPARVLVEQETGGDWHAVSTRAGEADLEIADAMGMSAEQFYQVVLLPQGEFARFLHADAGDRAALLQKLFRTDRFRSAEDWLADRRRTTRERVLEADQALATLVARIAQVAGVAQDEPRADGDDAPELPATWAGDLAAAAAAEAGTAAETVATARTALEAARAAEATVREQAGRQQRRAALLTRRTDLLAAAPQRDALRQELAAAERAAVVASVFTYVEKSRAALTSANEAASQARCSTAAARLAEDAGPAEFAAAEAGRRQYSGRLAGLRAVDQQAATEDAAAAQASARAADRARDLEQTRQVLAGQRTDLARQEQQRDAAQLAATQLPATRAEAGRLRAAAADAAQLADDCAGVRDLREQKVAAREHASDLREYALRLRGDRIDGMIGELAARLTDDAPCPVCGSLDHPDPSELQGRRVTHAQEEQAFAEAEAAQDAVAKLDSELAIVVARMGDMTARLITADVSEPVLREDAALVDAMTVAGDPDEPGDLLQPTLFEAPPPPLNSIPAVDTVDRLCELAADLTVAADTREGQAVELATQAAQFTRLEAELAALRTAATQTGNRLSALTEQRAAAESEAEAARGRAAAHRASLASQLDGAPDLDTALAAALELADALAAAARAVQAAEDAAGAARQAEAEAEESAVATGFPDVAAAQAAFREPAWRAARAEALSAQEAEAAAIDVQLADPALDVEPEPPADLAAAEEQVRRAAAQHDQAVGTHSRASQRADALASLAPQFAAQSAARQPLRDRAAEARQLADLAAGLGANSLRMTLSAFVLAARLEEVAEAASHRLLTMTAGRYRLAHTDTRRGGGRSGLGLVAQDAWTGLDRDTSTLSGGETFLASLALALGLADVVTAEAAGVTIETLFVDEGFGTLDEDTLEEVMTVLDGLREGGRLVGIVSHLAELRQRIPAQVHVRKGRTGSTIALAAS